MQKTFAVVLLLGLALACHPAWGVTFGEQGVGTSYGAATGCVRLTQCVCPAGDGLVNCLMLYVNVGGGNGRLAIYSEAGPNTPTALVVQSSSQVLTAGWNTFLIPTTTLAAGQTYWLACMCDATPGVGIATDPYDYNSLLYTYSSFTYGPFTDPYSTTGATLAAEAYRYCIYATMLGTPTSTSTSSATPTATPTPSLTPSGTSTGSPTCTPTPSFTCTPLGTSTFTPTQSATGTPTGTPTRTPTGTLSITTTCTISPTASPTSTCSPSFTPTPVITLRPTSTASSTPPPTFTSIPTLYALEKGTVITYPSPAKKDVWFYYYAKPGTNVTIDIYNPAGERVLSLADLASADGYQRTRWDCRLAAPGVYLYRLTLDVSGNKRDLGLRKLVVVK